MSKNKPGRPLIGEEPLIRKQVTIDKETIEKGKKIGGGYLSTGIRKAVISYEVTDDEKEN